jgi:Rrf2 family protein
MLQLARHDTGGSLSIPEISRAEGLSVPNVAKLMRLLRIAGFVASARGQAGGYTLARPPDQINVGDVLEALGGRIFGSHFCGRHAGLEDVCIHQDDCSIRGLWTSIQTLLENILRKTSLRDLMRGENEMRTWITAQANSLFPLKCPVGTNGDPRSANVDVISTPA